MGKFLRSFPEGLVPIPEESEHLEKKKKWPSMPPAVRQTVNPTAESTESALGGGHRTAFKFYPRGK